MFADMFILSVQWKTETIESTNTLYFCFATEESLRLLALSQIYFLEALRLENLWRILAAFSLNSTANHIYLKQQNKKTSKKLGQSMVV